MFSYVFQATVLDPVGLYAVVYIFKATILEPVCDVFQATILDPVYAISMF